LLEDVKRLGPPVILPHIPTRREGESCAARVVDDIFTVLTNVDESLRWKSLPKYVAESPDCMQATRLYDGDLAMLMCLYVFIGQNKWLLVGMWVICSRHI